MFNITVYSFSKKVNSTKRVTAALAKENTPMECLIKDESGIVTPHVIINYGLTKAPVNFNYAYIKEFKRYYFCNDWKFVDGLWECDLQEDFLATWRDSILNYTAYVLRSASKFDLTIPDMAYVATSQISIHSNEIKNPFNAAGGGELTDDGGTYIVGISGVNETPYGSAGSVTYYALRAISMQVLCNFLMKNIDYLKIDWSGDAKKFLTPELLKCLFNPLQYIASVRWYPYLSADLGTDVNTIPFGFWQLEVIGKRLTTRELTETQVRNIPIPKHPQAGSYGSWCNLAPYTSYQLHVSPYGIMDVPADELINSNNIAVEAVIDFATGNSRMMVASEQRFIQIANFEYGCEVQISQLVQRGMDAITSGLSYSLQHYQGNNLRVAQALNPKNLAGIANNLGMTMVGDIESSLQFIGDITNAMTPSIQSTGANGSRAWYYTGEIFWRLSAKFTMLTKRGDNVLGRPLCDYVKLSSLNGFTLCENASVDFEGNNVEQDVVNSYLNRGFYIE